MRILFLDFSPWDFDVRTPLHRPLGGTQSAAAYLAVALVTAGEEAFFLTHTKSPGLHLGVRCFNYQSPELEAEAKRGFDAVVIIQQAHGERVARQTFGPRAKLILWPTDGPDQQTVAALRDPDIRDAYDAFAMISAWQHEVFVSTFGIDPAKMTVLRLAISPPFEKLFAPGESIVTPKRGRRALAYTSTPHRGLDVLVNLFPQIHRRMPDARLEIYSGMSVYHMRAEQEQEQFGALYATARKTEGIDMVGNIPQVDLSKRLRSASVLAYPNTFLETSSVAVMEAMAAGCRVVTTRQGALPDTTAGFARLIDPDDPQYAAHFVENAVAALDEVQSASPEIEALLRQQVDYVNRHYTWSVRAQEWIAWLKSL